jgi:hypothetical protein
MEPAIKPAIAATAKGNIAVMATPMTLELDKFNHLMHKLNGQNTIIKVPSPELVDFVERGIYEGSEILSYLEEIFKEHDIRMMGSVVLGCTHFLYLHEALESFFGSHVKIFDGNEGTIRRVIQLLEEHDLFSDETPGKIILENSGSEEFIERSHQMFDAYELIRKQLDEKNNRMDLRQNEVKEIIEKASIDSKYKNLILCRYGIGMDRPYTREEIGKRFKMRGKVLTEEIEKAERMAFNLLKSKSIYDIMSQNQ